MKKSGFFLLFAFLYTQVYAQSILVQPYLQDAEPSSIKIMWETSGGASHTVAWGSTAGNLNQTVPASSVSSSGSGLIHEARLTGLTSNTRYYYQTVSDAVTSQVYDFVTPPLKSSDQSFNLVAMSDMQKDGSNPTIFDQVVHDGVIDYFDEEFGNDLPTDLGLVLIPGDLVTTGTSYSQWQNDFFDPAHPLFAHVPVYPVLGNHENNAGFYFQYFELPNNGTTGFEEHWWYKDYSNVRIIGLNSNSGYRIQAQLDWLSTTLADACADGDIDFVFVQLHHPHLSELWTPGEIDYTGDVIAQLETFSTDCGKPSIHFFGHTHGYSRGQSRDYEHLWVNVATAGGAIDNWGEFPNADYAEFNKSIDEYGFVVVNVTAGSSPEFTLRRISRGDQNTTLDNEEQDLITLKKTDSAPQKPVATFPDGIEASPDCITLLGSAFNDPGDFHQASHWQVAATCGDFSNPLIDSWKQHENWYNEVDTQAGDDLRDEQITGLTPNSSYCWRVRYRDEHLKWSEWSEAVTFTTGDTEFTSNLLLNEGGEDGVNNWTVETGTIESLGAGECNGINPRTGNKYLAVGGLCDGNETSYSEVYQDIDVSSFATTIDGGTVEVLLGGYLSNFGGSDQPTLQVAFLDAGNIELSSSTILTTFNSSWTKLESSETVPVNTRTLKVILTGTRNAGTDNDSYFDDLYIQLDTIPGENCTEQPLPVELISFSGNCVGNHAKLSWQVAEEIDLKHYEIMRSADGIEWVTVGSEKPLASTTLYKNYTHLSWENMDGGGLYYRLKIVDLDGQFEYSPIVKVSCENERLVQVFPNPVEANYFTLSVEQDQPASLDIQVVNSLGQLVMKEEWRAAKGQQELLLETDNWEAGVYYITVRADSWQWGDVLIKR